MTKKDSRLDISDIRSKIKSFFKGDISDESEDIAANDTSTVKRFVSKVRNIPLSVLISVLAGLIIILILVMIMGVGTVSKKEESMMDIVRGKKVIQCNLSTVNEFFDSYYEAMSAGDTTALESMYDDPNKARYSVAVSEIVESYSDLKVYVTTGLNDGEIAAFVVNNINFNNISVPAPSVDSFYIKVSSSGADVKIMSAMYESKDIHEFLTLLSKREPIRSVLSSTEDTLYGVLEENAELRNLYVVMNSYTSNGDK